MSRSAWALGILVALAAATLLQGATALAWQTTPGKLGPGTSSAAEELVSTRVGAEAAAGRKPDDERH